MPDVAPAVREFRENRAKAESPRGLFWVGFAIVASSLVNFGFGMISPRTLALHSLLTAVLWVAAAAIARPTFPASRVSVLIGVCATACIVEFEFEVWLHPDALGFAYALLAMLAAGAFMLSGRVLSLVAAVGLVGCWIVAETAADTLTPARPLDWVVAGATALGVGAVIMLVRLKAIDELGEMTRTADGLAQRDALTGLLNRHGLQLQLPGIIERAHRAREPLYTVFIDIDGLKAANDVHGHDFGDRVICVVADAMRALAPDGAALARWGGDEFIGVDTGTPPDVAGITQTMQEQIAASGISPLKWPGTVSIGLAIEHAAELNLERLIAEADAHMYARRRAARP